MAELLHRVKVFVYRMRDAAPDYLLLRSTGLESFWGPIQGPIEFGENLERAVRREVLEEVGLARPDDLIDLRLPGRWTVGDEEIIEWTFGFRSHQDAPNPLLAKRWNEFRWASYPEAYPSLELELDRAAITRLHAMLGAA